MPKMMVIGNLLSFMILFDVAIAQSGFTSHPLEGSGRARTRNYTRRIRRATNEHDPNERSKPFTTMTDRTGLPIQGPSFIEEREVKLDGEDAPTTAAPSQGKKRKKATPKQETQKALIDLDVVVKPSKSPAPVVVDSHGHKIEKDKMTWFVIRHGHSWMNWIQKNPLMYFKRLKKAQRDGLATDAPLRKDGLEDGRNLCFFLIWS